MRVAKRLFSADTMRGVSAEELAKFRLLQKRWWDPSGPLRSLHLFNLTRVGYITEKVHQFDRYRSNPIYRPPGTNPSSYDAGHRMNSTGTNPSHLHPHCTDTGCGNDTHTHNSNTHHDTGATVRLLRAEHRVLDVGCGGGILSEALARAGATVLGIDACEESITAANERLTMWREEGLPPESDWTTRLSYEPRSLFELARERPGGFDVVVASEVVEHVNDARGFVRALCEVTAPGGLLIMTTMDKSLRTAISHVLIAEYLTGIVERGTHDWRKFIPPADLTAYTARFGVHNVDLQYILTYPDLFPSIASRMFQVNFKLTTSFNTGHYFWTGFKRESSVEKQ
ncbi:unnamed protein product [Phytomonas sp. EM1]|nr:unnamed protein product [Phytomonas sp. EM1]|eukprot:CCW61383.1 unnamed protein product [Phytomonas sp. isolate EM1]